MSLATALELEAEAARAFAKVAKRNRHRGARWRVEGDADAAVTRIARELTGARFFADLNDDTVALWPTGGGMRLDQHSVAEALLRVSGEHGVAEAVAWLERLSNVTGVVGRTYLAVYGLSVEHVRRIGDIHFIPRRQAEKTQAFENWELRHLLSPQIVALEALAVRETQDFKWIGADHVDQHGVYDWRDTVQTALRAVAYSQGGAPSLSDLWGEVVHQDLEPLQLATGYSWLNENAPPAMVTTELDEVGVAAALRHLSFNGPFRRRIDIASERLILSRRRSGGSDSAIDITIAMEALLGDDTDNFDLSYKLRLRAALLLGENNDGRSEIHKLVKDAYTLRSKIVHGKTADDASGTLIQTMQELVARLLRLFSSHGKLPDFKVLELSGGKEF